MSKLKEVKHKLVDDEIDPITGAVSSKVVYEPDFESIFNHLKSANIEVKDILAGRNITDKSIKNDIQLQKLSELIQNTFVKYRTYLRTVHGDIYDSIKGVNEQSMSGDAGGYLTKKAFKNTDNTKMYKQVGYKDVPKSFEVKKIKEIINTILNK